MDLIVDAAPVCSPALKLLKVFSDPCIGHQTVDLKQMDFQIFLQQGWVYLGSAILGLYPWQASAASSLTVREGELVERGKGGCQDYSQLRVCGSFIG